MPFTWLPKCSASLTASGSVEASRPEEHDDPRGVSAGFFPLRKWLSPRCLSVCLCHYPGGKPQVFRGAARARGRHSLCPASSRVGRCRGLGPRSASRAGRRDCPHHPLGSGGRKPAALRPAGAGLNLPPWAPGLQGAGVCEAVGCSAMGRARGSLHQRWPPRRGLGLKRPCSSLDTAFRATGFDQSRLFSGVSGFTDGPDFVSTALAKSVVPARSPAVLGASPPWGHPAAHTRGS